MSSRAAWLLVGIGCLCAQVAVTVALAQDTSARLGGLFSQAPRATAPAGSEPELVDIERQLDALSQRADAAVAAAAIEHGRAALSDARAARAAGQHEAKTRKEQIAWAALSLAQKRIAAADAARAAMRAAERERQAQAEHARAEAAVAEAKARLQALREQAAR